MVNYYNERMDKCIFVRYVGESYDMGVVKFGVFIGDGIRIGVNVVLFLGMLLEFGLIVGCLELVE